MADCEHHASSVLNTSPYGKGRVSHTDQYKYYTMRKRQCFDCGEKFTTVEVGRNFMDYTFNSASYSREEIVNEMMEYLSRHYD